MRESRRVIGEYYLSAEDILNVKKFKDVIARGAYPMDIHEFKHRTVQFTFIKNYMVF